MKKYPKDIDKHSWDIMEEHTISWLYMIGYLAVIGVVLMIIKDVIWIFNNDGMLYNWYAVYSLFYEIKFLFPLK